MSRPLRICVPGIPLHVVQRGNNRQPCFLHHGDYRRYLRLIGKSADRYDVQIHAYVLMTNHVHLLITPGRSESASKLMQSLGSSYVRCFNRIHGRTGTLWEGRFRSFPIESEFYLFACYRYIELNPVRAGMVHAPEDYPWTSYHANALGAENALITPREEWTDLGRTDTERTDSYRMLFDTPMDDETITQLRDGVRDDVRDHL